MAIALDAAVAATSSTNSLTLTYSHTTSGSNRILFVSALIMDAGAIVSVVYGLQSMTKISEQSLAPIGWSQSLWVLVAPATGANNVVITNSSATGDTIWGSSVSYTGASQTGVPDAFLDQNGTVARTVNMGPITTIANNCWVVMGTSNPDDNWTASTNATLRSGIGQHACFFDSNGAVTPAGAFTMTLTTTSGNREYGTVMASFAPATGGGGATLPFRALLGVGK